MTKKIVIFTLVAVLVLSLTSVAFAQDPTPPEPCDSQATGTIVAVEFDEATNTYTVTIDDGTGVLCTVTYQEDSEGDYGHPITTLLGNYFGQFYDSYDPESYMEALGANQICVIPDPLGSVDGWVLATEDPLCVPAEVTDNGDGTFGLLFGDATTGALVFEDSEEGDAAAAALSAELAAAMEALMVDWGVNEDGSVMTTGDEIGQYHDSGFGFGVIVKVYGFALDSDMDVAALFMALEEGETSMGQLIKDYKETHGHKPPFLGVGHVRKEAASQAETTAEASSLDASGICVAHPNNGKGNANGKANQACEDPLTAEPDAGTGKNNTKTKTNNGKSNKNKDK